MELLQLKYFCDAAKTQNFSQTAKKFMVPPSDISQTVKRLEKELGVALFSRHANRIVLNENGKRFLEEVSDAMETIENAAFLFSKNEISGALRICINTNRRIVMQAAEKFRVLYPQVTLSIKSGADPSAEQFDLIFANEPIDDPQYTSKKMFSEEILLAVNAENPLHHAKTIGREDLCLQNFITMNESNSLFRITREICAEYGFLPHIVIQSDDPFYIRKCVELGLGVAFIPSFSWKGQFSDQIVLKKVSDHLRDTYLISSARFAPPAAIAFQKLFCAEISAAEL
ncbi:MAG: LysR family transcriptional regulator [Ruminococcaceae bacterium]|nr:LysR family transcriptional regulator [Oscillospiraceae bacterium]